MSRSILASPICTSCVSWDIGFAAKIKFVHFMSYIIRQVCFVSITFTSQMPDMRNNFHNATFEALMQKLIFLLNTLKDSV